MLTSPVSANMLSQICGELVIASVTRCVCALYAVYTHTHTAVHSTTHMHTNIVINQRRFDMQILHAKGISQPQIPVPNPDFDFDSNFDFDSLLLLLLHLSLPRATHPKLCCPSCRCVSKQPQISLTLQRFRQTKKKRKQSNVERSRRITFPCG